jgi:HlyD family secretion protein
MNRKKAGILIGAVVVLAVLGGTGFYFRDTIAGALPFFDAGNTEDKVYVEKVSRVMSQYTGISNRYNGTVESQDTYEVTVDSSRKIQEILVEEGDEVEEGQKLVTYDVSDIDMQVKQANLEVESINNDIDNYNEQIKQLQEQMQKTQESEESERFSLSMQIKTLQNTVQQKQYELESKQLEINKYKAQAGNNTVVSKVAGVVKEINENGVDSNGNSAPFMTILQTGEYRIKGSIDEQNIWTISEGQAVVIRSRVDESKTWSGSISLIDTENPESGNNNYYYSDSGESASKYPFYIELDSADGLILGQHVYIELDEGQEEAKEGLWLYSYYIVQEDGTAYVWAANEKNRLEKRIVELGAYDENLDEYEILSGLTENDYITWPMPGLYEGVTTVTNAEEVDYSSPLYNQDSDEEMYDEDFYDTEYDEDMLWDDSWSEDMLTEETDTEVVLPEDAEVVRE